MLLLILGAVWGASYLFIKVGLDGGLDPFPQMALRTLLAGLILTAYLAAQRGWGRARRELWESRREGLVLGAFNVALPIWLVAWGETRIDSGIAGIAQATVPIFTLTLGFRFLPHERVTRLQVAGVLIGLAGVAVLAGGVPGDGWNTAVGTLAVVGSSVLYGSMSVYSQLRLRERSGPVLATASIIGGFVFLLPFAVLDAPEQMPNTDALLAVVALAVIGTALAQLMLYRVLAIAGARRLSLVNYLIPGFALLYGALLLDEPLEPAALAGLALILLGVALGSGLLRRRMRSRREQHGSDTGRGQIPPA